MDAPLASHANSVRRGQPIRAAWYLMATDWQQDLPELWGGVECTIARVGNRWRDQIAATGHGNRLEDIDAIADLGIKTLRYPVLWETISPDNPDMADFNWHDARLNRIRDLAIKPIAGLIHHGSGPHYTSLIDPVFPERLARHAARVAARYPWIIDFTPVNEPLTTARFSALYGHWYPHRQNVRDFARALVNQCRATVLSIGEIRKISPGARLIQTEDLGKTFSTPLLKYQADYENDRRWLTFDLLHGRVDRHHPWFEIFLCHGIAESELLAFVDAPCPPDIIGINHYLTSDRFLDHRRSGLPAGHELCGNGRHHYADLEAVRVKLPAGSTGPEARLREAWERYGRPIAVTEVHHGCSREEQLRWLVEVWDAARTLKGEGADIRAVTVWALFGLMDWNSLLVHENNFYEPGAFDIRGMTPRPTALGHAARAISETGRYDHPVLDAPGWWHREERFYTPAVVRPVLAGALRRRLMIAGGGTVLGQACRRIVRHRGLEFVLIDVNGDPVAMERALRRHTPWALVDATGQDTYDTQTACLKAGVKLLTLSSDQPQLNDAGIGWQPKALAVDEHPGWLNIVTGLLFSPWDLDDLALQIIKRMNEGQILEISRAHLISPSYVPDLLHTSLDLLIDGETGNWHLANGTDVSLFDFGKKLAEAAGLDTELVFAAGAGPDMKSPLELRGAGMLPPLESAIGRFIGECEVDWRQPARHYAKRKAQ